MNHVPLYLMLLMMMPQHAPLCLSRVTVIDPHQEHLSPHMPSSTKALDRYRLS
jgi:hypothetical protein